MGINMTMQDSIGTLVIIRHGQSNDNLAKRWSGWSDAQLTEKGVADALSAGEKMKASGFTPDVVYSSTLTRARNTAEKVLEGLGIETNVNEVSDIMERHYGALTGKNKEEAKQEYGEELFMAYRRSYETAPPPMTPDHKQHPHNPNAGPDKVVGMPPNGKFTESLKDVKERVEPFWKNTVVGLLNSGKNVLLVAHGNSLRAMSMIVEGMTPAEVEVYEMPNTVPVMYKFADLTADGTATVSEKTILE